MDFGVRPEPEFPGDTTGATSRQSAAFVSECLSQDNREALLDFAIKNWPQAKEILRANARPEQQTTVDTVLCAATFMKEKGQGREAFPTLIERLASSLLPFEHVISNAIALIQKQNVDPSDRADFYCALLHNASILKNSHMAQKALQGLDRDNNLERIDWLCGTFVEDYEFLPDELANYQLVSDSLSSVKDKYAILRTSHAIAAKVQELHLLRQHIDMVAQDSSLKPTVKEARLLTLLSAIAELELAQGPLSPDKMPELMALAKKLGVGVFAAIQYGVKGLGDVPQAEKEKFLLKLYTQFLQQTEPGNEQAALKTLMAHHVNVRGVLDNLADNARYVEALRVIEKREPLQRELADASLFKARVIELVIAKRPEELQKLISGFQELANSGLDKSLSQLVQEAITEMQKKEAPKEAISFLERVAANVEAIRQVPYETHRLHLLEMFKIALFVESEIEKAGNQRSDILYLSGKISGMPRGVLIDFKNHQFAILSKKFGTLQEYGTTKKVTDSVLVKGALSDAGAYSVRAENLARLVSKGQKQISERELELERDYGEAWLITRYGSPKHPETKKTAYLQQKYETSLKDVTILDTVPKVLNAFQAIGTRLLQMHEGRPVREPPEGSIPTPIVHNDIKNINVLANRDGGVRLADLGNGSKPLEGEFFSYYITHEFNALEILSAGHYMNDVVGHKSENEILAQAKALDMFALGCLLYEVLHEGKDVPWCEEMATYVDGEIKESIRGKEKVTLANQILQMHSETIESLKSTEPTNEKYGLIQLAIQLLDADPNKRFTIEQFNNGLDLVATLAKDKNVPKFQKDLAALAA